jgi:anthranilate synthase component 1
MAHHPSYDQFVHLVEASSYITIYRKFANDVLTPVSAFYSLFKGRNSFLLESVIGGEQLARYSFLAVNPFMHFEAYETQVRITPGAFPNDPEWPQDGFYRGPGDPLTALESLLGRFRAKHVPGLPRFCGGAVGYVSYDAVRYTEKLPNPPPDDRQLPDLAFDFYDSIVIFDHLQKTVTITAHAHVPNTEDVRANGRTRLRSIYDTACRRVDELAKQILSPVSVPLCDIDPTQRLPLYRGFDRSSLRPEEFEEAVRKCREYIKAGDVFQVVLSQRLEAETTASPFAIYRALRVMNPSPFMFHLRVGPPWNSDRSQSICLVGSSPELMVRVEDGIVTIHPIAGTRPRGKTEEEDEALAAELLADPKERAEHIMLVDLGRNDVGRVAKYNSVKLDEVMKVERYSHVMHITTNVTGHLAAGKTAFDALRACLPAGTVSGAPKVRAMQIIDEIEPCRRGPYAGAVGFIDFTGNMETCLALRTLVMKGRKVYLQAGAGIVYDSVPEKEYEESINKAKGLLKAIEVAEGWRQTMSGELSRVLSCIQPTAGMHIGNYFGAVANWVALQDTHECVYGIVDLHAMTMPYDPLELRANTERMVIDLLACGVDPEKSILFIQSLVPEHTELCWLLTCLCAYGDLSRMTQFKEKAKQSGDFVSAGLFVYPVLQAADILMYRAKYVPVGKDQEQHLELSRVIARRFNTQYKTDFFPEPQPLFTPNSKIASLAEPEKKMSKSAGARHFIGLFEEEKSVRDKIRVAVTDVGDLPPGAEMSAGVANLVEILRACGKSGEVDAFLKDYASGRRRYSDLKQVVGDALVELTSSLRTRRNDIVRDEAGVKAKIQEMSEKARDIARDTMREVRSLMGLPERA